MRKEQEKRINFRAFKQISLAMSTYVDLFHLFNNLVELICRSFEVKGCSILFFDDREKELIRVAYHGISEDYLKKGPIPIDIKDPILEEGGPIIVKDMQNDPRVLYPEAALKEGLATMLCFPIKCRSNIIGLLRIYHSEALELAEYDIESFCILCLHLGLVIEHNGLKNFLDQLKQAFGNLPMRMIEGI